jgi:hypothetical protein
MSVPIYQITVMSQKYYITYINFLTFHLFHHLELNVFLPTLSADTSLYYHIILGYKWVKRHISSGLDSPGLGQPTVKRSVNTIMNF